MEVWKISILIGTLLGLIFLVYLWFRSKKTRLLGKTPDYEDYYDGLENKFIHIDNFEIHYLQTGPKKKPNLVMLHGIGASTFSWRKVIPLFAKHYRVTVLDLPGFGQSHKDARFSYGLDEQCQRVEQFLEKLGIHQARIISSSMGSAIGLWLARKRPKDFFEVVCLSPATNKNLVPVEVSRIAKAGKLFGWSLTRLTMRTIYNRVIHNKHDISDKIIDRYIHPFKHKQSIPVFLKATELIRDPRLPVELKDLSSRVLILYGEEDKVVAKKYMTELNDTIPGSRLLCHPEAGHHTMEDQPQWVYEKSLEFFNENFVL